MLSNCGSGEDLRVPWTSRSNQSILQKINPEYSLKELILMLKLQYFRPDAKSWLIGKNPDAGKTEGQRRREQRRIRWLDRITDSMDVNLSKLQEIVDVRGAWCATVHGVANSWAQISGWTGGAKNSTWHMLRKVRKGGRKEWRESLVSLL